MRPRSNGQGSKGQIAKGQIRPKISTMPRQQSEAAAYLDIYKVVIEKKRLQQELISMDQRRQQICDRIAVLEQQAIALEQTAHRLRDADPTIPAASHQAASADLRRLDEQPTQAPIDSFDTLFLDY
jgi:hypothetical protein